MPDRKVLKTVEEQKASCHVRYLINEGYDLKQASTFVGNHFMLSERQRLAIMRSLATEVMKEKGKSGIRLWSLEGTANGTKEES